MKTILPSLLFMGLANGAAAHSAGTPLLHAIEHGWLVLLLVPLLIALVPRPSGRR